MRILILTQWFQPEPHFKGLEFANALRDLGHEVEVLTGFPNYPGGTVYPGYRIRLVQHETMNGISVTRGYLFPSHDQSALRRIANYVSFAASTTLLALTRRKPDVVYVYTPPMTAALAAVVLRLFRRVPFVCDIQDLWPDTLAATGMVNNRRILAAVGWWTTFALRRAARIVVLSNGFKRRLLERDISTPVRVVPNWAPHEIVAGARHVAARLIPEDGVFTILFAGNMGRAQALDTVIEAARILRDRAVPIRFVMVGGGVEVERLKERAGDLPPDRMVFHPARHPSQMSDLFAAADALLVHLRDDPLFDITIPSKTQAYMAIGRPILLGVRGDAAAMVEEAGAGLIFPPQDASALADVAQRLAAMPAAERAAMGVAGRRFYDERLAFSIGVVAIAEELAAAAGQ
ncbi:glycosyltransferase family 4 protein [Sphingomonas sp. SORGH_AS_0879]|uniref:glycosyltransferase family 4 protein n=1 Tax=Sphingomonas sp. SORGH_AS_0879 TaxID=3041790 RepID=UPI002782A4F4|nr:glycosyltransferase family 4 protein [Sphingomonas sp. SORGH_AS_0879]MDQ1228605.1 colanic acid biosynthesis glycosyl transferase WcaI [Sphingomonas sp. SORGH_AS_0879]